MSHESYERPSVLKTSTDRVFGLVFAGVFLLVAVLPLLAGRPVRIWAFGPAFAFLAAALIYPRVLSPLNRLWMKFGLVLHKVMNPIVLGAMYFIVITPVGLLMRAFGKDPLTLQPDRKADTYWIPREPPGPDPDSLNRQF